MYFVDGEHKSNYEFLMDKKGLRPGQNSEYEAAFYVAAYPWIFECFDWGIYKMEFSPLGSLLFHNGEEGYGVDTGPLTGSTWQLVKVGQSLFNGYKIDLSSFPLYNEEMFNVFMQACKIRGNL